MSIEARHDPAIPSASPAEPHGDPIFDVPLDNDSLKRASVKGSLVTGLAQIVKMIVQFASQIVLARLLFPEDFGLVAMIFPVLTLIQIFGDLGFAQAIIQHPRLTQPQVSALFWICAGIGLVSAAIVALLAPLVAFMYGEPRVTLALQALAVMLPIASLGIHPVALLTRQMRFSVLAANEVIAALLGIAASIAGALGGLSYWSLILGSLVTVLVNLALNWLRCTWRPSFPRLVPSLRADLRFGGGITVSNIATFVTTSADSIIIGMTVGKVALGLFDRSYRLVVQPLGQVTAPLGRVALPLLCRLVDQPERYRQTFLDVFQALYLLTVPIMLVCATNAAVLIDWLLGPKWSAAAPVFAWICLGGLTSGIYPSATWLFVSQARTGKLAVYLVWAAIINLASFLIGSIGGIVWIAAAGAIGFVFITTPLVMIGATKAGPVTTRDLMRATAPIAAQSLLAYAVLTQQLRMGLTGLPQLVLATLLCGAIFLVTGCFIKSQRAMAGRMLRAAAGSLPPGLAARVGG